MASAFASLRDMAYRVAGKTYGCVSACRASEGGTHACRRARAPRARDHLLPERWVYYHRLEANLVQRREVVEEYSTRGREQAVLGQAVIESERGYGAAFGGDEWRMRFIPCISVEDEMFQRWEREEAAGRWNAAFVGCHAEC